MRTITFEVEVDDEIIPSFVPNIYDEVFKQSPHGRLFLCEYKDSAVKKLVRLHRDAEEGDKEAPWLENIYLPDEMRIVGMTGGNAAECINGKSKLLKEMELQEGKLMEELSRVDSLVTQVMQSQFENQQELLKKHEELLDHFKQYAEALQLSLSQMRDGALLKSSTAASASSTDDRELMMQVILQQQRMIEYYKTCVKDLQHKLNSED